MTKRKWEPGGKGDDKFSFLSLLHELLPGALSPHNPSRKLLGTKQTGLMRSWRVSSCSHDAHKKKHHVVSHLSLLGFSFPSRTSLGLNLPNQFQGLRHGCRARDGILGAGCG